MSRPHVLIVGEGSPNFWFQIVVAFHAAGCRVSYVTLHSDLVGDLVRAGAAFDLVVTNQLGIHAFALPVRDDATVVWERHFKRFLMVQFHDVFRELPSLAQAGRIFGWKGMRLAYFVYCRKTFAFLQETKAYWDCLFSDLPIAFDDMLNFPETAPVAYVDDVAGAIIPRNPAPEPERRELSFFPKIIYIGSYFFDGTVCLRPDGPFPTIASFQEAVAGYLAQGRTFDRFGFVKDLFERGTISQTQLIDGHAGEYLYNYGCTVILPTRRQYVEFVKKTYGADFHLYGSDWQRFGLDSIPGERAADDSKYRSAFVSVDFGSTFVDNSLYQRIMQILASGGRLMQLRQPDSAEIYGPFADHVCFDSPEELRGKLDAAFAAPAEFLARQTAFARYMRERYDPAAFGRSIIGQLGLSE